LSRFSQAMSKRVIATASLFLIGSLHTMIFAVFQIPENFLLGRDSIDLAIVCKIILYTSAIGVSLSHQILCRWVGLKMTLYLGLLCNLFGLATLMLNQFLGPDGTLSLVILDMVFFGVALTSVINSLVTYIILQYPKKAGLGIVALFAFLNLGAMLAPLLLDFFHRFKIDSFFYPVLIVLIGLSLFFVRNYFKNPLIPVHLERIRRGSLLWKELHYRLALFVIAIIAYGLTESTFNLWGFTLIQHVLGASTANDITSFFWLFMIIGQVILLLPLYFLPASAVFYFLVSVLMGAAFIFPLQTTVTGFIGALILAGAGCSAVFPILLSLMEKEMLPFARGGPLLHYIEVGISVMLAGYFVGVGFIDLWVQKMGVDPMLSLPTHFHLVVIYIGITCFCTLFLQLSAPKIK